MPERTSPPPGDPHGSAAGSIPPSAPKALGRPAQGADPVEQEWERIERERVAEEIAEAREDVIDAISHPEASPPEGLWVWWAFAAALLAGVVFAVALNLLVVRSPQEPGAVPPAGDRRPPSASEAGPGVSGAAEEGRSDASDPTGPS